MSYQRQNKMQQVKKVQDMYQKYKQEGMSTMHVYREYIYPVFLISRATFYNYLSTPASKYMKVDAKKLNAKDAGKQRMKQSGMRHSLYSVPDDTKYNSSHNIQYSNDDELDSHDQDCITMQSLPIQLVIEGFL